MRRFALLLAAVALLPAAAGAHRTPEAHVRIESASFDEGPQTVVTVRMSTEDALVIAAEGRGLGADLADPEVLGLVGRTAAQRVAADAPLRYFGGEVEGDLVFLFLTGPEDLEVRETAILSSVHTYWTNYLVDARRPEAETRVFTQGGRLPPHTH